MPPCHILADFKALSLDRQAALLPQLAAPGRRHALQVRATQGRKKRFDEPDVSKVLEVKHVINN
jgi:hypothetical protein